MNKNQVLKSTPVVIVYLGFILYLMSNLNVLSISIEISYLVVNASPLFLLFLLGQLYLWQGVQRDFLLKNAFASDGHGTSLPPETSRLIFNPKLDNMTNIFFQNGMLNNYESAEASANLIRDAIGQEVGLIVNSTGEVFDDVLEYLPTSPYLKDALNGEVYQQIVRNNGDKKSLIIMHSAGNNDAYQAAKILNINNVNLEGKIDFISVGSPLSTRRLRNGIEQVGGNVIGGYNNILDPVTNSKAWALGGLGMLGAGAAYGATVGIGTAATGTGLEAFGSGLIGGGIGGSAIVGGIKIQHPFEKYWNKDFKNLKRDINDWSANNN